MRINITRMNRRTAKALTTAAMMIMSVVITERDEPSERVNSMDSFLDVPLYSAMHEYVESSSTAMLRERRTEVPVSVLFSTSQPTVEGGYEETLQLTLTFSPRPTLMGLLLSVESSYSIIIRISTGLERINKGTEVHMYCIMHACKHVLRAMIIKCRENIKNLLALKKRQEPFTVREPPFRTPHIVT